MRGPGSAATALAWFLLLAGSAWAQQEPGQPTAADLDLLRRATTLAPYSASAEARQNPQSLGFFFPKSLYAKLRGNPIMGYLYDEGYASGGNTRVCLKRFRYLPKAAPHAAAFQRCVSLAFEKAGLQLSDTGRIELGVALLGVVAVKTEQSLPGLCVEFYLSNRDTGKTVFMRRSFGHQENLIKAMMEAAVCVAARAK